MRNVKGILKAFISCLLLCLSMAFTFNLTVKADDGATKETCMFGENSPFSSFLHFNDNCYCWLIFVFLGLIILIMLFIIFLVIGKIKRNKEEEEIETANYIKTYKEMMAKKEEERRQQEEYDAKMNDEDGCEDILVELAQELSDDEKLNLDGIKFEMATEKDKVDQDWTLNFRKPKTDDEDSSEEN